VRVPLSLALTPPEHRAARLGNVGSDGARRELRSAEEVSRRRTPAAKEQLSTQELQIARIATEGRSNRQIVEQLFLSHRTVSTHLYHIFPKLGITARAELRPVLETRIPTRA